MSLAIIVQNGADTAVGIHVGSRRPANFVVTRPGDTAVVWTLLGATVADAGHPDTVPAHGTRMYGASWAQQDRSGHPVGPGTYCVRALIDPGPDVAGGRSASGPAVAFRIGSRD